MTDCAGPSIESRKDEWLVVRCQLGERAAFDELIDRWHQPLWTCVRRLSGDAEVTNDIVQDVWLRVLRGIGSLRDGGKWRSWLFGIARRVWIDRLRRQYAAPPMADVDITELAGTIDTGGAQEEDIKSMELELTRLPFIEREVLTLFYLRELSLVDVADILAVPVGTVKSRLNRARQRLRNELLNTKEES